MTPTLTAAIQDCDLRRVRVIVTDVASALREPGDEVLGRLIDGLLTAFDSYLLAIVRANRVVDSVQYGAAGVPAHVLQLVDHMRDLYAETTGKAAEHLKASWAAFRADVVAHRGDSWWHEHAGDLAAIATGIGLGAAGFDV